MSLGTILCLNFVLGTIEMHWMLASLIMKVFSPCDYWSQYLMINKLSSSSLSMYLGNKYLPHVYFSNFQPCVGCFWAWKFLFAIVVDYILENFFLPPNPKSAKMCMKFNLISICTYFCGVCPMYRSISKYYGTQWV